ncbi:MAG: DNA repair protein RecN [Erysipelotrichaceae bacterium]|nr:DNA repair protein RecN [Erysipelotrichaceae bacterium]
MINRLYIRHYAIIEELELEFSPSFTVFTGETGAGKSIIIGALSLLTGERADTSVVSYGQDHCLVEGVFTPSEHMKKCLEEAEIDLEEEVIVSRRISAEGRSSARVNGMSVTLSFLQQLFAGEADIHSQRDNQHLLKRSNHLLLTDRYANSERLRQQYGEAFRLWKEAEKTYQEMLESVYDDRDLDYLRYNLKELNEAAISEGEEEELLLKEKRLRSSEKTLQSLHQAFQYYEEDGGISEKLYALFHDLSGGEELQPFASRIEDLYYSLEEEISGLHRIADSYENDEDDLDRVEERLYLINRLKRKYNTDEKGLLEQKGILEEKIAFFDNKESFVAEQEKKIARLKDEVYALAKQLSDRRKQAALSLQKDVHRELQDLMMPNVRFLVDIKEKDPAEDGRDDLEFLISLNKGEEPRPLIKVASGGELSRLMLGLKTIFTHLSGTGLLVFDEIDSGVSGKVALAMGLKMALIARDAQVLTITHLSSVAACADEHFRIYKEDDASATHTRVSRLSEEERIGELARISGQDSAAGRTAAAELLEKARTEKKAQR